MVEFFPHFEFNLDLALSGFVFLGNWIDRLHQNIFYERAFMVVQSKNVPIPENVPIKRALLSVSNKSGLIEFARELSTLDVELISTGGTKQAIADAGLKVTEVSEITGFPEIMDGRVKSLHPAIHGGLLAIRDDKSHSEAMAAHNICGIDLVCVNLYPFEESIANKLDYSTIIENIDIGGPAMIRAAAKNHAYVTVVVDEADYQLVVDEVKKNGQVSYQNRQILAAKAFSRTASYDSFVSNWFADNLENPDLTYKTVGGALIKQLRYGENPHQTAGFYKNAENRPGVATADLIQGKALSYNNINDSNAAIELVCEFNPEKVAAVAIIKHANPCGVSEGKTLLEAYKKALDCDRVSAFGGIVALNRQIDSAVAQEIINVFAEVIIAPSISEEAKLIFAQRENLRLLITGELPEPNAKGVEVRTVAGGMLLQTRDLGVIDEMDLEVVTKRVPSERELSDLKMAYKVVKHVKSNAIVLVKDKSTVGIGAGQMSRVDSSYVASRKAIEMAKTLGIKESITTGCVAASDAFFPFADGLLTIAEFGATAIIQPGGSIRDDEIIEAADKHNLAMIFTGTRHFKH